MTRILVVDASVAVKWLVPEPDSAQAEALFRGENRLVAPDLLLVEVANALWRRCRKASTTPEEAEFMQGKLPQFFARVHPVGPLLRRALAIGVALDHPVYDCVYLALAERENCPLVTADARLLARTAGLAGIAVVPLSEFAPDTAP